VHFAAFENSAISADENRAQESANAAEIFPRRSALTVFAIGFTVRLFTLE
jgi:hypothetical protein